MTKRPEIFTVPPVEGNNIPFSPPRIRVLRRARRIWPETLIVFVPTGITLLAPLPLASNHPLIWLFWAILLGLTGFIAALTGTWVKSDVPKHARTLLTLGLIFVGFALFQGAPLPALSGGIWVELPSGGITLRNLSLTPGPTILGALRITSYLLFFCLMLFAARDPGRAKTIGKVLFFGITIHALIAILALKIFGDTNFVAEKYAFFGMATGTFVNRNSLATHLGMGLILGLGLLLNGRPAKPMLKPAMAVILPCALGVILVALALTRSRMGITASFLAAIALILGSGSTVKMKFALVLGGIGLCFAIGGQDLLVRFFDLGVSGSSRLALYGQITDMIAARPLTGFGVDSFPLAFEQFHAPGVTAGRVWDRGHSTYLTLWAECGVIIGSIPPLIGFLAAARLWNRSKSPLPGRTMARVAFAALALGAIHSLVDFSLEIQANAFLLLALVALGLGPEQNSKGKP